MAEKGWNVEGDFAMQNAVLPKFNVKYYSY